MLALQMVRNAALSVLLLLVLVGPIMGGCTDRVAPRDPLGHQVGRPAHTWRAHVGRLPSDIRVRQPRTLGL
jgi:hypothetical protein